MFLQLTFSCRLYLLKWWEQSLNCIDENMIYGPGMVAHICNPTYSGGRDKRIMSLASPGKFLKTVSQKQNTNKRLRMWLKWWSTCLACLRSWVHKNLTSELKLQRNCQSWQSSQLGSTWATEYLPGVATYFNYWSIWSHGVLLYN
jgi:hypothetical protein